MLSCDGMLLQMNTQTAALRLSSSTIPTLHNRLETLFFQKSSLLSLVIRFGLIPRWLKMLLLSMMCAFGNTGLSLGTTRKRKSGRIIVTPLIISTRSYAILFTSRRPFMSPNPSSTACKSITTTSQLPSLVATMQFTISILFLRSSKVGLVIYNQHSLIFGIAPSLITSVSRLKYLVRLISLLNRNPRLREPFL